LHDYYEILGVQPSSSHKEIKRAFRTKAKRLHPDLVGDKPETSLQMRLLLEAYETLSDPDLRREYDKRHKRSFERFSFDYRAFLKSRPDDPECRAKLVFYDIFHGWEDEALEVFDASLASGTELLRLMDREDAMDCSFLLAEEYERRERYPEAFERYRYCIEMEREKPYFRHFFPEVQIRIKELVRVRLSRTASEPELLGFLGAMASMGFPKKERARFLRHRAEVNVRLGRLGDAKTDLLEALELDRKLSGIAHLKKWTGIE
jgi:tetratricopeptide (TPR) repeat protein